MDKNGEDSKCAATENICSSKESNSTKSKAKNRGKKRKRRNSGSSSDYGDVLPENSLEVERSLHASAIKNNLDETSVRKIIKKVVTNDRVLALVKMREEEDSGPEENSLRPKLTRAKVKELMKVSPKTGRPWNLDNLELTPIKHIPVKTRPEVKALIAQELPEDEDDEEYEPTQDDIPSDDDQGLESCSDLDSQPRTPATPRSLHSASPKIVKDGPFKVPQDVSTPTRRKLDLEEDATIALRTRSKLSLSATSIEHIESTFVPPDDIPMPAVDDLWNQFLNECLNPASMSKNEDDDETDPEYNVAADADAHDEDEEALSNSIIKISKKELNDLVTELFNIMPEATPDEQLMADNLANSVLTDHSQNEISTRWEGKQEPLSDDENGKKQTLSDRITFEKQNYSKPSAGKTEPVNPPVENVSKTPCIKKDANEETNKQTETRMPPPSAVMNVVVEEQKTSTHSVQGAPALLQPHLEPKPVKVEAVHINITQASCVLPEQVQILQQQLRQHVQLATSSYLQLYIHPVHWSYAPKYKEYLETFVKLVESNPQSVANVCNLKPAVELMATWESTVSLNTPENHEMVKFIQNETDKTSRRWQSKNYYAGEFHEMFKKVVANSPVFLYPYLLPPMPFRGENTGRRYCYLLSEDELIAIGLEQFWKYVIDNPSIFKPLKVSNPSHRWGLSVTVSLVTKYMFPWLSVKVLHAHIQHVRKLREIENPIFKYFQSRSVTPVKHKLLPYNPAMTLYEQPEHEVPRIWLRYLANTSKRFKNYLFKRTSMLGVEPRGVDIQPGLPVPDPYKSALPIDCTHPMLGGPALSTPDKFNLQIANTQPQLVTNLFRLVETSTGAMLVPLTNVTTTVNANSGPITTPIEINSETVPEKTELIQKDKKENVVNSEHCTCCILIRKILKQKQTFITDYFGIQKENKRINKHCGCKEKIYPKVSNRLRLLVNSYKSNYTCTLQELQKKLKQVKEMKDTRLKETNHGDIDCSDNDIEDIVYVTRFHLKLLTKMSLARKAYTKRKIPSVLHKFNPNEHDPLELALQMDQIFGNELVDMYKEFLGFLTPEQADKLDAFKDYFIRNCITDLVKKVDKEVTDAEKRHKILKELNRVFSKGLWRACEMCTGILSTLEAYPRLAQYVFELFPHRKEKGPEQKDEPQPEPSQPTEKPLDETAPCDDTNIEGTTMDYEADQSMSEEEDNGGSKSESESENNNDGDQLIKTENTSVEYTTPTSESISLMITVSKTEVQDFSECSNSSMKLMFDDEVVKLEGPEWKREEDKLILEVLKEHLTPEERQDKTILETIEEKNIIGIVSESITHKTKQEIKTRILYLLQIC